MKQNNQIQTVVRLKFPYLFLYDPINNLNVRIYDGVHGNEISTNNAAVMYNFNNLSVVITTHLKTEIIVSIRKIITK